MATELHSSPRGIGAVLALTAALHVAAFGPVAAQAGPGAMVPPASPEAGDSRSRAWVSLGLTWAAFPEDIRADVGLLGALTFQRGPHHVSLRGMGFTEIVSGADNVVELAALYGRTRSGSWAHAAAAVGLAAVVVGRGSPPEAAADIPIETLRAIVVLHPVEGSLVHGTAGGGGAVLLFRKQPRSRRPAPAPSPAGTVYSLHRRPERHAPPRVPSLRALAVDPAETCGPPTGPERRRAARRRLSAAETLAKKYIAP